MKKRTYNHNQYRLSHEEWVIIQQLRTKPKSKPIIESIKPIKESITEVKKDIFTETAELTKKLTPKKLSQKLALDQALKEHEEWEKEIDKIDSHRKFMHFRPIRF